MFRAMIRYTGLFMVVLVFIASGISKITTPTTGAALLAQSNFPRILAAAGITLTPEQYVYLIQLTGAIFISFSLFILLGVGRSFFAFMLAVGTLIISVTFHLNLDDVAQTSQQDMIQFVKNISITGGLLFIAASSSRRRPRVEQVPSNGLDRNKKKN